MSILYEFTYKNNKIPIKITSKVFFLVAIKKLILMFTWKDREVRISKTNLKKEIKLKDLALSFQIFRP